MKGSGSLSSDEHGSYLYSQLVLLRLREKASPVADEQVMVDGTTFTTHTHLPLHLPAAGTGTPPQTHCCSSQTLTELSFVATSPSRLLLHLTFVTQPSVVAGLAQHSQLLTVSSIHHNKLHTLHRDKRILEILYIYRYVGR